MTTERVRGALRATVQLAAAGEPEGSFRALVSAYGVKYRIGWALWHTIEAGAFAASIKAQPAIPIYQMHSWSWSELPIIGSGVPEETERGLEVAGRLYVDDLEMARAVWLGMKDGALREWSIGYRVTATRVDPDDEMHEFVTEGELMEASSVLRGANPETETLNVAGAEHGRTRITTPDGMVIETSDPALIARLTQPAPVKPAVAPADGPDLLAPAWAREMHGDALAGSNTTP